MPIHRDVQVAFIALIGVAIGSSITYYTSYKSVNAQIEIEKNKLNFENEKFFAEYIIKNGTSFTKDQRRAMISIIDGYQLDMTISLVKFIIESDPNEHERKLLNDTLEKSLKKNIGDVAAKNLLSSGKSNGFNIEQIKYPFNQDAITNVLNDIANAYDIAPNRCYMPISVHAIKSTYMYSDIELKQQIKLLPRDSEVTLEDANEISFSGKYNGLEGYFRLSDFKRKSEEEKR